ncbi:MAG TPA: 2OG-Fe(II) oxygenase [Candidatus Dormibacteraeota bacterium]|nr:2OG-Fe(II) oxygenase [Candidatus Dormibacteraeota bacterium]
MAATADQRLRRIDWARVEQELDAEGWSRLGPLLSRADCRALTRSFDGDALFRATVDMERHGFGRGVYRYFAAPLPPPVSDLRRALYARLVPTARRWAAALGERPDAYPDTLGGYLAACHAAGQRRPTPLLLRYRSGDYNCLHQDLYGALAFPLQVVIPLSRPGADYDGGELLFLEQRPRRQSRATAVAPAAGEGVVFANRTRPCAGRRGFYRVQMRHGLSTVRGGERLALGLIFHDAR